ncbi:MAG: tetratricopeptide repeat protein [Thermodesulfobacteriota bacterium]
MPTIGFFAIVVIIFLVACQDIKQIKSQLPNPVRDFTEKDPYIIGLRWYEYGEYDIARKYWEPLAEHGDCDAAFSFGLLYFEGRAVSKSYEKATEWWTKAANQGQPQAQNALGVIYAHGEIPYSPFQCRRGCGVSKDLVIAYTWLGLASESGSPREENQAKKLLEKIKREMAPEQISAADGLIRKWRPDPSQCTSRRNL